MIAEHPAAQGFELRPEYLATSSGRIFVLFVIPRQLARPVDGVIVLPPFAEEMNKSRHMLAMLGQQVASKGVLFVLPDLYGTGDSEGEFGDGTWEHWTSNIQTTLDAVSKYGVTNLSIVALRLGVFLLPDLRGRFPGQTKVIMWNPVQQGSKMIDQILRSKVIRESANGNAGRVATVRSEIRNRGEMEVAGYRLTAELLEAIDRLDLSQVQMPSDSEVQWIDISPVATEKIPPNVEVMKHAWEGRIRSLAYSRVLGSQFWMGPEIDLVPDLVFKTTAIVTSG